jgi:hypothetical protein
LIEQNEIDAVVEQLGGFGSDNRAYVLDVTYPEILESFRTCCLATQQSPSCLRILCVNVACLFRKTTVVREVTRLLAERCNVCIVDTSNEIAGDGDIPHPCVGFARRMMVPSLDRQSAVMIECVQNHTPEVMVIDEIGRPTEVEAARTCKNRGV